MKNVKPLPKSSSPVKRSKARLGYWRISLSLVFVIAACLRAGAGEITLLRDAQGHCVYVSREDRELRNSVKRGGIAAAERVIDQRKAALVGIDQFIEQTSEDERLDPRLVRAMIQVESAWNAKAKSDKGALGLMQLMPETALRFGVRDPFDGRENILGGTRYLRFLLDRFHGNLNDSLAAYNAGEKAVAAWGDIPPYRETRSYIARVQMIYAARQQEAASSATAITRSVEGARVVDYTNLD